VPVNRPVSSGTAQQAAAFANRRQTITLSDDAETFSQQLNVTALPRLVYWLRQTVPAVGNPVTVRFQFSVRGTTGGLSPVPEWLDVGAPIALVPNVPTLVDFAMPCASIRVGLTRAAGVATTVEIVLAAAASS
jgi:hypothetical protein